MADPHEAPKGPPPRPMWVKISLIVAGVIVAVGVIIAVATSEHGPGRHLPGGSNPGGHTPPVEHSR